MSDLKFGTDKLNEGSTYRDKLIEFIKMDMPEDGRKHITFKDDGDLLVYATYVANIESGCTQRRAVAAVCAIGADVLYSLEVNDIDKDKYNTCRPAISKILLSKSEISQVLKDVIVKKSLFVIKGVTGRIHIWSDVSGFVNGFADRYHLESSTVFTVIFWLGLDKLINYDELYYCLEDSEGSEELLANIELAKGIINRINDFNDDISHLNDEKFL